VIAGAVSVGEVHFGSEVADGAECARDFESVERRGDPWAAVISVNSVAEAGESAEDDDAVGILGVSEGGEKSSEE